MDDVRLKNASRIVPFQASDGVMLNGILSSTSRSKRCIIFVHGMGGSAFSHTGLSLINYLPRDFSVFSINTRAQGGQIFLSRYKRRKRTRVLGGTNFERFEDSKYDIKGAINAMSRHGFREIILCGQSTGCQKVTYYQYKMHDRRVKALVLVAPTDDHNLFLKALGRNAAKTIKECIKLVSSGKGNHMAPGKTGFSAQRLDSIINPKRVEGRLFDYEGDLKEFASIRIPILAIFGDEEENAVKDVSQCLDLLGDKTSSSSFSSILITGGNHSFYGKEKQLVKSISNWIEKKDPAK